MHLRTKDLVLRLLDGHRVMAIGTNRLDGWPQVTLVGYINDGFLLYCFIAHNSQKHAKILRDSRVSIAIGSDASNPLEIKGLSLAGRVSIVTDQRECEYVSGLRLKQYTDIRGSAASKAAVARIEVAWRIWTVG